MAGAVGIVVLFTIKFLEVLNMLYLQPQGWGHWQCFALSPPYSLLELGALVFPCRSEDSHRNLERFWWPRGVVLTGSVGPSALNIGYMLVSD